MVERKYYIPNLSFAQAVGRDKTPRCPTCGARNPFGTHCQVKKGKR